MAKLKKRRQSTINNGKIGIKFNIKMLDMLLKYLQSDLVNMSDIGDVKKLFDGLDMDVYQYNLDIYNRVNTIRLIAEAKADHFMKDHDTIYSYVISKDPDTKEIMDTITWDPNQLTSSEISYISNNIRERLQFYYIYLIKDSIIDKLSEFDEMEFISYHEMVNELRSMLSKLLINLQNTNIGNGLLQEFNFSDAVYRDLVNVIVNKAKKPGAILQTGIRMFNSILSPGFASGRLYTILGLTGKFKSGTLLNIADQIRRFNPQIVPVENGKRKTILFVSLENSIEETFERLYDMYSDLDESIAGSDTDHVIQVMKEKGQFQFDNEHGIDIEFIYRQNLEIDTADLYNIIQELSDRGKQVICVVLDYIKRIDSVHESNGDERTRLSYVAKELKSLAQYFEIPVITAMQINREGNSIVDAAMREDKADLARFVGSSNIANCWDIAEDSDWMAVINLEMRKSDQKLFLTIKRVKIRGKKDPNGIDYFNHPFTNEKCIRLETDVDKDYVASVRSLASSLESVDQEKLEREQATAQEREKIAKSVVGREKAVSILSMLDR